MLPALARANANLTASVPSNSERIEALAETGMLEH
jgi:hypothetical protein